MEPLLLTLRLAAFTSIVLTVLGAPVAWLLVRHRSKLTAVIETILLMPLVLPPTVLGFYLLVLMGDAGPLARAFDIRWAFTFEGILLGSVLFNLPFAMAAFGETFRAIPSDLLDTARTLGASRGRIVREVVLPLAWPGLLAGATLVFAHTIGEFGVVLMIGGSIPGETRVLGIHIYELVQGLRFDEAHRVAIVSTAMAFALLLALRLTEHRWRSHTA
ncbi:MAG TPA: molybdate ABC transporter permease subunit [Gemmatimonadales bacterium]|nr:molybdate ABC transporter permease subunit [Gemmatimonadales bacterium]